jgi:hypothetical protein
MVERATTLLNAIGPLNTAEARQRDKAFSTLERAHDQITCAQLRSTDKRAACP